MILTCPDCSTRYSVKDGSIGPNGRTVRCASCNATWFVSQDADELALADLQTAELETIDDVFTAPAAPTAPLPPEVHTPFEDPASQDDDIGSLTAPPATGAHVEFRDKVDRERRNRRLFGVSMIWVVTLGLLGTFAILGYTFRQPIVDRNPAMASLYKIFDVNVKTKGLDFEAPATRHVIIDGVPNLVVSGMIINRSNTAQPIPMIELSFANNSGEPIAKWIVEPSKTTLEPQDRLEYVSQYPNPPVDAVDLSYRFLDDAEVKPEQGPTASNNNGQ